MGKRFYCKRQYPSGFLIYSYSNNFMQKKQQEKGFTIFLAIITMSLLLSIGLGINTLILSELRILRGVGDSVFACGAADAGIERVLYIDKTDCDIDPTDITSALVDCLDDEFVDLGVHTLTNGSGYTLVVEAGGTADCPVDNYCAKSKGRFQRSNLSDEAIRKIRISR